MKEFQTVYICKDIGGGGVTSINLFTAVGVKRIKKNQFDTCRTREVGGVRDRC